MIIKGGGKKSPRELSHFVALFPFQIPLTQTFQVFLPVEKTQTKRPRAPARFLLQKAGLSTPPPPKLGPEQSNSTPPPG